MGIGALCTLGCAHNNYQRFFNHFIVNSNFCGYFFLISFLPDKRLYFLHNNERVHQYGESKKFLEANYQNFSIFKIVGWGGGMYHCLKIPDINPIKKS